MPLRIIIANRLFRIPGVLSKIIGYIFHFIFPKKRFTIPKQSDALFKSSKKTKIPKILWQTINTSLHNVKTLSHTLQI